MSLRLLRPRLGQLFLLGCREPTLPVELVTLVRAFDVGGMLLTATATGDVLQVADLTRATRDLCRDVPPWVGLHPDAPGPLPTLAGWPALVSLGQADAPGLTRAWATALAHQRLALGLTIEWSPVLDLGPARHADVRHPRTLGADPAGVGRHAALIVDALQGAGVAACARDFPGVAQAQPDAGVAYPLIEAPPDHLAAVEWVPFRAAIAAGVAAVMASHVLAPGLDAEHPVARSPAVLRGALRGALGFGGVIVSDDLSVLPAETDAGVHPAVAALAAGCDVLTYADGNMHPVAHAIEQIIYAAERQTLPHARLEDALARHEAMKVGFLSDAARRSRPPAPDLPAMLAAAEMDAVAARMRQAL